MYAFAGKDILIPEFVKERFMTTRAFPKGAIQVCDSKGDHPRNGYDANHIVRMKESR
jgi:hypothetical protein